MHALQLTLYNPSSRTPSFMRSLCLAALSRGPHPDAVWGPCPQTLQMGVYHFSGLFVLLCLGLASALLSSLGEHVFYRLVLPRIRRGNKLQYWLHTSQVRRRGHGRAGQTGTPGAHRKACLCP